MKQQPIIQDAEHGFNLYQSNVREPILDLWPAWEYFHIIWGGSPVDYYELWRKEGGKIFPGVAGARMIALKDDPIWAKISKFGLPYPPFDRHNVMWVRDVERKDAEALGLIGSHQKVSLPPRNWSDDRERIRAYFRGKPHSKIDAIPPVGLR